MASSRKLRIAFSDFWAGFDPRTRLIGQCFLNRPNVELVSPNTSESIDLLVIFVKGESYLKCSARRILLFSGENIHRGMRSGFSHFKKVDYVIATNPREDCGCPETVRKFLYLPYAVMDETPGCCPEDIVRSRLGKSQNDYRQIANSKNKFCSFVVSNGNQEDEGVR